MTMYKKAYALMISDGGAENSGWGFSDINSVDAKDIEGTGVNE